MLSSAAASPVAWADQFSRHYRVLHSVIFVSLGPNISDKFTSPWCATFPAHPAHYAHWWQGLLSAEKFEWYSLLRIWRLSAKHYKSSVTMVKLKWHKNSTLCRLGEVTCWTGVGKTLSAIRFRRSWLVGKAGHQTKKMFTESCKTLDLMHIYMLCWYACYDEYDSVIHWAQDEYWENVAIIESVIYM